MMLLIAAATMLKILKTLGLIAMPLWMAGLLVNQVAQIKEVESTFNETAKTFGLAVAILIVVVVTLAGILYLIARTAIRWLKPMIEKFFDEHIQTMVQVRESSASQADSSAKMAEGIMYLKQATQDIATTTGRTVENQKAIADVLAKNTTDQSKRLDSITEATLRTNDILIKNGESTSGAISRLAEGLKAANKKE